MTKRTEQESPAEMNKQGRKRFELTNQVLCSLLEPRAAFSPDTRRLFVSRMQIVLKLLSPELTIRSQPLYAQMTTLVQELKKATPSIRIWHPPLTQRATKGAIRAEIARFTAKRDQIVVLLKETCLLHHMEPALAAQEAQTAYKHAQSTRASQPRKLDEHQRKRIANRYWEAKQNGTAYGIVKALAREYEVSSNTIQTAVNKYKPN